MILEEFPNFHSVDFQLVINWGTWSESDYRQKAIWKSDHPLYREFLEVLKDPIFNNPKVRLGNVAGVLTQEKF